jgi:hypothetical protein
MSEKRLIDVRLVRDRDGVWRAVSHDAHVSFVTDNNGRLTVLVDSKQPSCGVHVIAKREEYT